MEYLSTTRARFARLTPTRERLGGTTRRASRWTSLVALATLTIACGPTIASEGDSFGTGDTGGEAAPPDSTGPIVCVEMSPGAVTCWVDWAPGVDAAVLLPCQVALGISGGAWGLPYDSTLEGWGLVTCHDITGTDNALCLYGDFDVLLTRETGLWLPQTNTQISNFPAVAAPCGDDPGDGDGDPGDGDPVGDGDGDPIDDGRLKMVEFVCADGLCQGRWDGTDLWSAVIDADVVDASVVTSEPWACDPDLDVDVCIEVDQQGHVGCFWYQDGWAVAVAPSCAVSGVPWLDVGNSMLATAV